MKKLTTLMALAVAALVGCAGSDGSGPGAVQGTAQGNAIHVVDAVSAVFSYQVNGTTNQGASIVMTTSSATDLCSDLRANVEPPSTTYVSILLWDRTGDGFTTPSAPGEYTINADMRVTLPKPADIAVLARDATCQYVGAQLPSATSGTVDLSSINGNVFDGTFDVTLSTGEHLTGDFAPSSCPGIDKFSTGPGANCYQ